MKKFLYVVSAIIFCCCSNSALCEVEETTTYGTPPTNSIGLPMGTDVGGMTQHMIWGMQHNQSVQNGRSVYEQIKEEKKAACIKKAQSDYNEYVGLIRVVLLDNSATNCQQKFPAQATLYWLNGNDNAYSQCIRADEQHFNSLVDGAKEVLGTKLKGCAQ